MKQKQTGMFWHCHHDILLEYCHSYDERKRFIVEKKPENEIETRLRLFKPVMGKLPKIVVDTAMTYDKERTACEKARDAYGKARDAYDKAAYGKAGTAYEEAWAAHEKAWAAAAHEKAWAAWAAHEKAWAAYEKAIEDNLPALLELHKKECPDCPWQNNTIFPNKG